MSSKQYRIILQPNVSFWLYYYLVKSFCQHTPPADLASYRRLQGRAISFRSLPHDLSSTFIRAMNISGTRLPTRIPKRQRRLVASCQEFETGNCRQEKLRHHLPNYPKLQEHLVFHNKICIHGGSRTRKYNVGDCVARHH